MNAVWRVHWNEAREREHFGRNNILRSTSKWISSVMCNWNGWEMVKRCFWFRLLCRKRPFSLLVVWLTVLYYAESTLEISVRAFFAERCHIFVFIRFVGLWFGLVWFGSGVEFSLVCVYSYGGFCTFIYTMAWHIFRDGPFKSLETWHYFACLTIWTTTLIPLSL